MEEEMTLEQIQRRKKVAKVKKNVKVSVSYVFLGVLLIFFLFPFFFMFFKSFM